MITIKDLFFKNIIARYFNKLQSTSHKAILQAVENDTHIAMRRSQKGEHSEMILTYDICFFVQIYADHLSFKKQVDLEF